MHKWMVILGWVVLQYACSSNGRETMPVVNRDISIIPSIAFTRLVLDSLVVENYISREAGNKYLGISIRNFYNHRNFQYAWFDEEGLTEQGEAFWNLHQSGEEEPGDSSVSSARLHKIMDVLLNEDSVALDPARVQLTELDLTLHFFMYLQAATRSKIQPEQMQWFIPRRKINEQAMLDSFISSGKSSFKPMNDAFYRLQDKMKQWAAIAKSGGWPVIQMKKGELRPGVEDSLIRHVKKRLLASGDYLAEDTGSLYNKELETAVKKIQRSYGMRESGIITVALVNKLNVKTTDRLKQMKVNLERMRWMPLLGDGIYVNIPEFRLHVYHGGEEVLAMNIVCGKAATRTVIFSDHLEYIVFSPYWNVPPSIVRNELLPVLNSSYLRRHNMEITGHAGGLPVVRQKPGPTNALGLVKFLFPNRYNIYLHDTPTKQLFETEKRAFSHGCIRIQKPFELAKFLLRKEPEWTVEAITAAMHRTSEKWVPVKEKVPVYVVYFTSWVDEEGWVHFRDDVYGHDKRMAARLFTK